MNKLQLEFGRRFVFWCKRSGILKQPSKWHSRAKKPKKKTGKKCQPRPRWLILAGVWLFYETDSVMTETAEDLAL